MHRETGGMRRMRILVHDFAGHPFQVQLSRALAARGHEVVHAYCASLTTTPTGALSQTAEDPATFTVVPLSLGEPLEKYHFLKRWRQENRYGDVLSNAIIELKPDVIVSGNTPLDAQKKALATCRRLQIPIVHWAQDLIGVAARRLLDGKWMGIGNLIGGHYVRLEKSILSGSDAVVAISEDFVPTLKQWDVRDDAIHVIENWAPLDEVPVCERDNAWALENGFSDGSRFIYSGTLGLKHNPDLLLQLALHRPDARVIVVSQGKGAEWLIHRKEELGVPNLQILGFQPFERIPEVLAAADILVAVLEPEADVFSVPSKVLTYLCAARPVLLAVPAGNLAARIVERIGCGAVVPPTDKDAFLAAASNLLADPTAREHMGARARAYAEEAFDIEHITTRFEHVLESVCTDIH